jgi:hypothetical protein
MKSLAAIIILSILLLVTGNGWAQTRSSTTERERPPLPKGKLLREWEDRESWTIFFQYADDKAEPGTNLEETGQATAYIPPFSESTPPRRVDVTHLRPYWTLRFYGDGKEDRLEYYCSDNLLFVLDRKKNRPSRLLLESIKEEFDLAPPSHQILATFLDEAFFGFDWIAPRYYVGVETKNGVRCLLFEKEGTLAWVDFARRQPVRWENEQEIRIYQQNVMPASHGVPDSVIKRIQAIRQDRKALNRPAVRGG